MSSARHRSGVGILVAATVFLAGAIAVALWNEARSPANPDDAEQVAQGRTVYVRHCASCHGLKLEGQHDWREKLPTGRMPAPPHDASGHTWHHPDAVLFGITKNGLIPGRYAPPKYESDMPAFAGALSDEEIWAVLAYITSSWPPDIRKAQHEMTRERDRR
jgi:mono/diheme cytochrome c family protein